jgi:hypothetical protein
VESFYQALAGGLPVADALRSAKLEAIRRGAPPKEWAVFTAVGDPLVQIPLRRPASGAWLLLLGLPVAAAARYLARRRRLRIDEARGSADPTVARTHQR